jgi:hypothetical protein
MKALMRFLRVHGETIIYTLAMTLALCVLGPSLDRYDAERAAVAANNPGEHHAKR